MTQNNSSRKYHLTFHKPPSHNNIGAYHFKIDNAGCKKLVFDIIDRKFYFEPVPNQQFPVNQNLNNVLNCILETLNDFLNLDRIKSNNRYYYPTLDNGLNLKGKIGENPTRIPYIITKLENRVNERINGNATNNTDGLDFSNYDIYNTNIQVRNQQISLLKTKILQLTHDKYMTKQDVEEMFFVLGIGIFSNTFVNNVYTRNSAFRL